MKQIVFNDKAANFFNSENEKTLDNVAVTIVHKDILKEKDKEIERLNEELNCYKFPSCKSDDIEVVRLNLVDMMRKNKRLEQENERLNNIINEFDKWLDEESEKTILSTGHLTCLMMCKNKLKELKGDSSNGNK